MAYSIYLLYESGRSSCLAVHGRTEWSDKRRALYHGQGLLKAWPQLVEVTIRDEFGQIVETVERRVG
jgi:hypothetical protein